MKFSRDAELVAWVLSQAGMDPEQAENTAEILVRRYGSLAPLLEAAPEDLQSVGGASPGGAALLSLIPQIAAYTGKERASRIRRADTFDRAAALLRPLFVGSPVEKNCLLCLGARADVLATRVLQVGTVDETPFYLRSMVETLLRTGARAAVLCHNHPSGTAAASEADIEVTRLCLEALDDMGIAMPDHIIVAGSRSVSIRRDGRIPEERFARCGGGLPAFADWYEEGAPSSGKTRPVSTR